MRKLVILLLMTFSLVAQDKIPASQKPKKDLESIKEYAIKLGSGSSSEVYVFVDPLCSFSKALMKQLTKNKMAQATNSYYILLYRLPRLDSVKTMEYILESKDKAKTLLEIMVDGEVVDLSDFKAKDSTKEILSKIESVAKTLDMKERPYMISFEKDSPYCRVSEGSVSCLEELSDE